eukprot:jgi/Undpi1/10442/HiC_scaffold_29.g12892.m1
MDQRAPWLNLTNCMTDSVLERCGVPIGAKVLAGSSAAEEGEPGGLNSPPGNDGAGRRSAGGGGGWDGNCAAFPSWEPIDPQRLTKINMDGSEALRGLIASTFRGAWTELLGELQLSFVLFVSLSSLRGFRHWQALSALLCRCGDALATDPALFTAFIRMLHAHLKLVPEDFFDVELSKDNFLVPCLSALLQNVLPDKSLAPKLADAGKRLLKFLRQRFGLFTPDGGDPSSQPSLPSPSPSPAPPPPPPQQQQQQQPLPLQSQSVAAQRERAAVGVVVPARARGGVAGRPKSEQGEEEEEEEGGGGLSLMQLELSEEDLPAVVPYEEVLRVLGGEAIGGSDAHAQTAVHQQGLPTPATPSEIGEMPDVGPAEREGHARPPNSGAERGGETSASTDPVNLSTPSAEHSQRWRDIDRLPSASAPQPSGTLDPDLANNPAANGVLHSAMDEGDGGRPSPAIVPAPTSTAATAAAAAGGYAAAAAKRYPLLFGSVGAREDVMMAAARLMASEGEATAGDGSGEACAGARAAAEEAVAFLMEVEGRQDGGASAWQLAAGPRSPSR